MKNTLLTGAIAALLAGPAMAQTASLDDIQKEIAEMKAKNERLEAEVEYLKENAKAQRKGAAEEEVALATLNTKVAAASKFSWSGDFRFRDEQISTAAANDADEHTRSRDRIRLRFGVQAKVNDTITAKLQLATSGGNSDPRSTNQTLGEGWTRKGVAIDLAYVDWKPSSMFGLTLGKMPQPWVKTNSYFWDGDITPEGAAAKFSFGNLFGGVYYDWLNERHSSSATGLRSDSKLVGAQVGLAQPIGPNKLTVALGYFDVTNVQNEIVNSNSTFFGGSANGNTTTTLAGNTVLASGFKTINALAMFDFKAGRFPMNVFVDYLQNTDAEVNPVAGKKLDKALSAGITFNKASAPKSWEVGLVYQKTEKDSVFGQFVDSDFGDGKTDADGYVIKAGYVPAINWTLNATYIINKLNNDGVAATANTHDLDYKRLQLDLNYKF